MSELIYKTRDIISYRTRNIMVAAALALLAVVLTLVYVSHARSSAQADTSAPVKVLVAARDIPIGTSGATLAGTGWLVTKSYQHADVPSGAMTTRAQVASLVAIQPTYAGEQLVARRFGTTQQEGVLAVLHGTYRIVQLPGDANQLLSGTLKVGNHVDVVGSVKLPESGQTHVSTVFLRNLLVVGAPSKPSTVGDTTSADLRVTTQQAQRLFWLQKNADWSLLLRPATKAADKPAAPTTAASLVQDANGR
ncbi:MAG TPA: Flp pilus assembly protein CpaB [Gaiellaceae bacterium]|nr:Flp pilus assembly protein CpaB [Gaiellaceae bacterium]